MRTEPQPNKGEVWRDRDPRGGPTFVVVAVDPPHVNGFATVEGLDGKRRRRIRLNRFRSYELLGREA